MAAGFRLIAFLASAIGVELARGAGLATLVGAALVGFLRISPLYAIAAVAAGTALSLALPEEAGAAGKVAHGLSNAPFLMFIHILLGMAGFGAGRLLRLRRR